MARTTRNTVHAGMFRHVHTVAEKRAWSAAIEQGVKPRARRSPRQLPSNWDDIPPHMDYEMKHRTYVNAHGQVMTFAPWIHMGS